MSEVALGSLRLCRRRTLCLSEEDGDDDDEDGGDGDDDADDDDDDVHGDDDGMTMLMSSAELLREALAESRMAYKTKLVLRPVNGSVQ